MKLLYISCYQFLKTDDGIEALPAYSDKFWEKYLSVFDSVHVLGEEVKGYLKNDKMTELSDPRIFVEIIPGNTNPKDFINDRIISKKLEQEIKSAEAILIKPSSRKGIMALKLARKYNKPYMIELTGDLMLTLSNHKNVLKRLYAPYIYGRIKKAIKPCKYGLYVTESYLQKIFPIDGKQCGATDAVLDFVSDDVLKDRIDKINAMTDSDKISIGLIGFYHDNRKGIDTAIEALSKISPDALNCELNILALGTQEDRDKWHRYAKEQNMRHSLNFPQPCDSAEKVFRWIDTQDIIILPSRSEGLPRCLVEAMSRACPVISTTVCGIPELIEEKWLHKPADSDRLAGLITEMSKNKENMIESANINFEKSKNYLRPVLEKRRNGFLREFKEYCIKMK